MSFNIAEESLIVQVGPGGLPSAVETIDHRQVSSSHLSEHGAGVSVKCLHLEKIVVLVEAGIAQHPVRLPVSVVARRIGHGEKSQKLAECWLILIAVYILHDNAFPHDLVSEGREQSVYGMSGNHECFQLPLFVLKAVNVLLLRMSAHIFLLHLFHLCVVMS